MSWNMKGRVIAIGRKTLALALLGCAVLAAALPLRAATTYKLSEGFNAAQNPNGAWSYGWKPTLTGAFTLLDYRRLSQSENGVMVPSWELDITVPAVYANTNKTTTAIFNDGTGSAPPGTVWFAAGLDGYAQNYCAIRFTVPTGNASSYTLGTAVKPVSDGAAQGDADFHVLVNGFEVFKKFVPAGDSASFTNQVRLRQGDTVDFMLGRGTDGQAYGSLMKIDATLSKSSLPAPRTPALTGENAFLLGETFSLAQNPSGAWSFGWKETVGGDFGLLPSPNVSTSENGLRIPSWELPGLPAVYMNTNRTTAVFNSGSGHAPAGSVWFYPGDDGTVQNFGAIRFTVPASGKGTYRVSTTVKPVYTAPVQGDTDFHVVVNGDEIFRRGLSGAETASFLTQLDLEAGDTVDFLIGRGADGHGYASSLLISAVATAVTASTGAPGITLQPASGTVNTGDDAFLFVGARGAAPLHYQWYFKGSPLPGETNSFLALGFVGPNEAGGYSVKVSNSKGFAQSDTATLTVIPSPPPAPDPFTAFSTTANPSLGWSFGWKSTLDGDFNLLTVPYVSPSENSLAIPSWQYTGGLPAVYINTNADTAVFGVGTGHAPAGSIWYYPGNNGTAQNFGAIRYKVPPDAGGFHRIAVAVAPVYTENQQGDTDFHVVINGAEVFGTNLDATATAAYTNVVNLTSGSTVDFLIGRGLDASVSGSGLLIDATVEPAVLTPGRPGTVRKPRGH